MNDNNLVSILMPAYNAEKFINQAIWSILNQDYINWELLILDDASTDRTSAIIREFNDPRIKFTSHKKNEGYLRSCNQLFKLANGDFITFLDADDTCPSNRLSECLAVFKNIPETDFLTTDNIKTDEIGNLTSEHSTEVDYQRYSNDPSYYPTICCATIMLRKNLLQKVGGYHPFFEGIGGEDYHWLFRLSLSGKGVHLKKNLYRYRTHNAQLHENNRSPLKFFVEDIDKEIRTELISNSKDLLNDPNNLRLNWESFIKLHPDEVVFKNAGWMLNRNEKKKSFLTSFSIIKTSPLSITSWHRFFYMSYSILMR